MNERLILFDTTLRDGEQAPGFSMDRAEKLRVAEALDRLGVDVIEAGFPTASPGDFESVQAVARVVQRAAVAGLARCVRSDIDAAASAVRGAQKPRLHTFLATSPIHREHKLRMSTAQVIERIRAGVAHARGLCEDVEFSAEDASRTEPDFLVEAITAAVEAGATTINLPDTVGYSLPHEIERMFLHVAKNVAGIGNATLSAHCHDDLGLAVANSLAAVRAGARQVEVTLCGIGERAGNASLEEVAMAVRSRSAECGVDVGIDTKRLHPAARLLEAITGQIIPRNKAIVGANAFSHEAGIHQHGVLAHRETYEIMRPEDVGQVSSLVLGKHSGRHALRDRLRALEYDPGEAELDDAFAAFKALADRKKEVHDEDLHGLMLGAAGDEGGPWSLDHLQTTAGTHAMASAAVRVRHVDGREVVEAATGDGPVDASFRALVRATQCPAQLDDFQIKSLTLGEDAQGRATVRCSFEGRAFRGQGVSTDIVEASGSAFLDAINRIARHSSARASAAVPTPA